MCEGKRGQVRRGKHQGRIGGGGEERGGRSAETVCFEGFHYGWESVVKISSTRWTHECMMREASVAGSWAARRWEMGLSCTPSTYFLSSTANSSLSRSLSSTLSLPCSSSNLPCSSSRLQQPCRSAAPLAQAPLPSGSGPIPPS